jgi:hypothetical protein
VKALSVDRLFTVLIAILILLFVSSYALRDMQVQFFDHYPELNPANGYVSGKVLNYV